MLRSVIRRFLTVLICLTICAFAAAAEEELRATLTPDTFSWKAGETVTFSGTIRHPGQALGEVILKLEAKDDLHTDETGDPVFTSVNGEEISPDWQNSEITLAPEETKGDLLRFSGQWIVPQDAKFTKSSLRLYVVCSDGTGLSVACELMNAQPPIDLKGLTVLELAGILLAVIAVIVGIWSLLMKRKKNQPEEAAATKRGGRVLDTVIIVLFFLGVIITPTMVRMPLLREAFPDMGYFQYFCFPGALALLLSFLRLRKWTVTDLCFFAAWLLLVIPMCISNRKLEYTQYAVIIFQNLLPIFFILYRMNECSREKTIRLFLTLFNIFVVLMLAFAIEEKITHKAVLKAFLDWLVTNNMYSEGFGRFIDESRFFSFWGHPLTNALIFNSMLVLNTAWYKFKGKTINALLFYPVAMAGVLLSGSKTGITVCLLMLLVICWKHKKWLLLCIPVFAALYFTGVFDLVIYRFTHTSLTTGRIEALTKFFSNRYAEYPFQWLSGYSSNIVLNTTHPLFYVRAGFEFPLLMSAFDYGIIFSIVFHVGFFGYFTWRCLKKRQWTFWISFVLLYAEVHTYNAFVLRNNDVMYFVYFIAMLILNMLPDSIPEKLTETIQN